MTPGWYYYRWKGDDVILVQVHEGLWTALGVRADDPSCEGRWLGRVPEYEPDEHARLKALKDQLRAAKKASPFWADRDLLDIVGQTVCEVYDHPEGWEAVYGERRGTFQTWTEASEQATAWAREDGWDISEKWEGL